MFYLIKDEFESHWDWLSEEIKEMIMEYKNGQEVGSTMFHNNQWLFCTMESYDGLYD